jgi:ribosomal protein S18 acetylase RimI-like enzyme
VVIRRLVPGETGPTGGPAFTDLLGICTAWGPTSMSVAPDSGAPVEILLADIVSGKPVPPRPSHLARVSARDAELHTLALWPGLETRPLGEWVLRTDPAPTGRLLKRANSCLALGSPGRPLAEAVEEVLAFYAARGRAPMMQVEAGAEVEAALRAGGWVPLGRGEASFRAAPLSRLHRLLRSRGAGSAAPEATRVGENAAAVALHGADGTRVAAGSAVLDGEWLAVHGLTVDERHRRRGLATAVMAGLVEWGAEQGARTVWLHVETDNAPALALYERLGFSEHHVVRYLVPGPASGSAAGEARAAR